MCKKQFGFAAIGMVSVMALAIWKLSIDERKLRRDKIRLEWSSYDTMQMLNKLDELTERLG